MLLFIGGEELCEEDEDDLEVVVYVWVVWLMDGNLFCKFGL